MDEFREVEMVRRFMVFLMFLVILICVFACTTTPKFNFPQGTRVGIINLLEPYVTHQQFSSLGSKDNFKKTYEVDWDMPSYAEGQLKTQLAKNARFTSVKIKLSEPLQEKILRLKMVEQVLVSQTAPPTLPPQGVRLLDRVSQPYDVQVVILIGSFNGPGPYRKNIERAETVEPINIEGYGLFTRWLFRGVFSGWLSFRKAYSYAQIGVVVYKVQPVTYVAAARAIRKGRPLRAINDFNWDANIRNLSESELNRTKNHIEEYINETINKALRDANLIPSSPK
jgi:hypothetical protein